ncbi:ABC transporter substrate-binding protein [Salidesulfovibrio brasiliensis]|uniref:ABC transporter substrate-binding protein n=1 Tax=Salidesulfovibrio brasiliensis TaxID=221711 RepID=UPI000A50B824|nr:hypothetical protein [Salidesulfovibrio brasiliensis]
MSGERRSKYHCFCAVRTVKEVCIVCPVFFWVDFAMKGRRRTMRNLLCIFILVCLMAVSSEAAQADCVVLVNSYHQGYRWVQSYRKAFVDNIAKDAMVVEVDLDTKRIPRSEYAERARKALALIDEVKPEVVVLADDNAFALLAEEVATRKIPVVFLGVNSNPRNAVTSLDTVVGVLERPLVKRSIPIINEVLNKDFRNFLVLFDVSTTSEVLFNEVFHENSIKFMGYTAEIRTVATYDEWKKAVLAAPGQGFDAIMLGVHNTLRDEDGRHVPYRKVARWTNIYSTLPLFAFWDFSVSSDMACGGLVLFGGPQGEAAAQLTNRLLEGANIVQLHTITAERGKLMFSGAG